MCHLIEQWCKIWRRAYLSLQKWYEELDKFSRKQSKVSKMVLWWVPFVQSILMYELKIYTRVMCNDTEEWSKIWSGMDLSIEK